MVVDSDELDSSCFTESIYGRNLTYLDQKNLWDGLCETGGLQSPIDLPRSGFYSIIKLAVISLMFEAEELGSSG